MKAQSTSTFKKRYDKMENERQRENHSGFAPQKYFTYIRIYV